MKKSKKLLIALLSATCLTAGAFGFAACGNANDSALYKVYTEYVASAGENPLSYEDWLKETLNNVGKPGDKGEPGTPGKPGEDGKSAYDLYKEGLPATETPLSKEDWIKSLYGAQGKPGKDGISITGVQLSTDGKKLVFSFSEGADVEIALPESFTHVHTYAEGYTGLLIAPSGDKEGLAYKVCTDNGCEHIELVVVPSYSYKVTVYLSDFDGEKGTAAAGATVTLKKGETTVATVTADENGEAIFDSSVEKGEYDIVVEKDGYVSYGSIAESPDGFETTTSDNVSDYLAVLVTVPAEGNGSSDTPYLISSDLDNEVYHLTAIYDGDADERRVYFTFTAAKSGLYTFTTMQGVTMVNGASYETVFNIPLVEGDSVSIWMYGAREIDLCVACEEADAGSMQIPYTFESAKEVSVAPAEGVDDEYTYFVLNGERGKYQFNFASGLELLYLGNNIAGSGAPIAVNQVIDCSAYGKHYFKAKTTAATINFTATLYFQEGEKGNPVEANLNSAVAVSSDNFIDHQMWYKVTLENGLYILDNKTNATVSVYSDINSYMGDFAVNASKLDVFEATAGTYYLNYTQRYSYYPNPGYEAVSGTFTVKPYDSSEYSGLLRTDPATLEAEATYVTGASNMFYVYTATQAGFLIIETNEYYTAYSDETFETRLTLTGTQANNKKYLAVEVGDKVYLEVNTAQASTGSKITTELLTSNSKIDYSVTLVSDTGHNLDGITVSLLKGGEVIATQTTDNEGVARFNVDVDAYEVSFELGADSNYKVASQQPTGVNILESDITINVLGEFNYTFTVTNNDSADISELKFVIEEITGYDDDRSPIYGTVAELDLSSGTASVDLYAQQYRVTLSGVPEGFECDFNSSLFTPNIQQASLTFVITAVKTGVDYESVTLEDNTWSSMFQGEKAVEVAVSGEGMANLNVSLNSGWYACIDTLIFVNYNGMEYQLIENGKATSIAQGMYASKVDIAYDDEGHGKAVSVTVKSLYGAEDGYPAEALKIVFKGESPQTIDTALVTQS